MRSMKNKFIRIIALLVVSVLSLNSYVKADSKDAVRLILAADSAYKSGKYGEAAATYESIMQMYGVSASTLYNLGNAYVKSGDLGKARVCYERARKLEPGNKQINNNLMYISSKIEDTNKAMAGKDKDFLTPDAPSFLESVNNAVAVDTSSNSWAILAVMSFIALVAALALYIFSHNVMARKTGFFSSMAFLVFTGIFVSLAFVSASEFNSRKEGVVTSYRVGLQSNPDEGSKANGIQLTQGTKAHVEEETISAEGKVEWYRIRLNSRVEGWIKSSDFEII